MPRLLNTQSDQTDIRFSDNLTTTTTAGSFDFYEDDEPKGKTRKSKTSKKVKVVEPVVADRLEIELEIDKVDKGLEIVVQSALLGKIIEGIERQFYEDDHRYNNKVYCALHFYDNYKNQTILHSDMPNLEVLRGLVGRTRTKYLVQNVFTTKEINKYVKSFGDYIETIKEMNFGE